MLHAMLALGRRLRQRLPGDQLEVAALPLLRSLEQDGPARLSALAEQLGMDASTISRQVRSLEERGLVERGSDPDDGRASRVRLSARGRAALEAGTARRRALLATVLDRWSSEDREQLRLLLQRLQGDLAATPVPVAPDAPAPDAPTPDVPAPDASLDLETA